MPNILDDGLLDQAVVCKQFSQTPTNQDFLLQAALGAAINTACSQGLFTASISVAAYPSALVQAMIPRLVNTGYNTPTLSGTTLTVTWN